MSTGLQPIREALNGGFSVDNLRLVAQVSLNALHPGPLRRSGAIFAIAEIALHIAEAWDNKPIDAAIADRVERAVAPHLRNLLSAVDADCETFCSVLDAAVDALVGQIVLGLDTDIP